jgi:hypothetical protein
MEENQLSAGGDGGSAGGEGRGPVGYLYVLSNVNYLRMGVS